MASFKTRFDSMCFEQKNASQSHKTSRAALPLASTMLTRRAIAASFAALLLAVTTTQTLASFTSGCVKLEVPVSTGIAVPRRSKPAILLDVPTASPRRLQLRDSVSQAPHIERKPHPETEVQGTVPPQGMVASSQMAPRLAFVMPAIIL